MSLVTHFLSQDANIISTDKDAHGDQITGEPEAVKCRFRYVTGIEKGQNVEALADVDAIIWFEADANISESTIIQVDDSYWRIDRLVKARRMAGDTVQFLKAYVQKHSIKV